LFYFLRYRCDEKGEYVQTARNLVSRFSVTSLKLFPPYVGF